MVFETLFPPQTPPYHPCGSSYVLPGMDEGWQSSGWSLWSWAPWLQCGLHSRWVSAGPLAGVPAAREFISRHWFFKNPKKIHPPCEYSVWQGNSEKDAWVSDIAIMAEEETEQLEADIQKMNSAFKLHCLKYSVPSFAKNRGHLSFSQILVSNTVLY